MSYVHHIENFYGLPVFTFPPYANPADLPEPGAVAWRFQSGPYSTDEESDDSWDRFIDAVELEKVRAVILGYPWYDAFGGSGDGAVIKERSRFTGLEAIFLGDLEDDEAMISQIDHYHLGELLEAFPGLRELGVRGGNGLDFPVTGHQGLRVLRVESGGLPPEAVAGIAAADLPALVHLELWLGDDEYGGGARVEHLAPLLTGERKPALRHLGLQNSPVQDELAAALASAPVVSQLTSLSLSMGTLSDEGAEALLQGQPLTHLKELDLSHHFLSPAMMLRIWASLEPSGVRVNVTGRNDEDEWELAEFGEGQGRYIAVAE